jgi:predicted nucleic acid-binding Zn ribbon protein
MMHTMNGAPVWCPRTHVTQKRSGLDYAEMREIVLKGLASGQIQRPLPFLKVYAPKKERLNKRKPMENRECRICGAVFSAQKYLKTKSCSEACRAHLLSRSAESRTRTERTCVVCGDLYMSGTKNGLTCSISCSNINKNKKKRLSRANTNPTKPTQIH